MVPKIFYTNSSYEYWGSGASLLHTTPNGSKDVPLPPTTRMYLFAGGQHGPAAFPPRAGRGQNLPNFNDYTWTMRALLGRLQRWIDRGEEPPPSLYPTIRERTLVRTQEYRFPRIPNVLLPETIHTPRQLDFTSEPPRPVATFAVLVPQSDSDGHDIAGIRMPWIDCPTGTFTGWNRRSSAVGATDQLLGNTGSWIPLQLTSGTDPRRGLRDRYTDEAAFASCVQHSIASLVSRGLLLQEDTPSVLQSALAQWRWRTLDAVAQSSASR